MEFAGLTKTTRYTYVGEVVESQSRQVWSIVSHAPPFLVCRCHWWCLPADDEDDGCQPMTLYGFYAIAPRWRGTEPQRLPSKKSFGCETHRQCSELSVSTEFRWTHRDRDHCVCLRLWLGGTESNAGRRQMINWCERSLAGPQDACCWWCIGQKQYGTPRFEMDRIRQCSVWFRSRFDV